MAILVAVANSANHRPLTNSGQARELGLADVNQRRHAVPPALTGAGIRVHDSSGVHG